MITLAVGDLAFLDSVGGRVPCRVIDLRWRSLTGYLGPSTAWEADAVVTAARPGYDRSETVTVSGLNIYPRTAARQRFGQFRIAHFHVTIAPSTTVDATLGRTA